MAELRLVPLDGPDLPAAVSTMVRVAQTWEPRPHLRALYDRLFRRYLAAYPLCRGLP